METLCINCAISERYYNPKIPSELPGTEYQLEKYIKHTSPSSNYHFNSVFSNPSTMAYRDYIVSTLASGYVEVDDKQRLNIVWVASKEVGVTYLDGRFFSTNDTIKVVLHDDIAHIHAFPIAPTGISSRSCIRCGKPIF